MTNPISVAVFPVAGRGTRFLPATKANPKEMLPVVDKPLIQYAVEEALQAGVETLVFVTGRAKRAIEDHFDRDVQLENELEQAGKHELLKTIQEIVPSSVHCVYIRQGQPLGLGHAVLCAEPVVGRRPFFVHLADDLIAAETPCLKQMQTVFEREQSSVVAVQSVPDEHTDRYGIVAVEGMADGLGEVRDIIEKPAPAVAPSNLGVVGRYALTPSIFDRLNETGRGAGGEIQLTDAIGQLLRSEMVFAYEFAGNRFDCGDKVGYLEATVAYGLNHPELGAKFKERLALLLEKMPLS
ncbi:MAG: UTP--glucose-1-phosphate uridylyltransferase GalU [Gammaproteobacteria bacterium]